MTEILYKDESYKIIGLCMEVYNILGKGFSEIVYKDALEYEFKINNIPYLREKEYIISYKEIILPHKYDADFVVFDKIILEVKAVEAITQGHLKQSLNYLAASKMRLSLVVNFGEDKLNHKRVIL